MSLFSKFWDLARQSISYFAAFLWGQGASELDALNRSVSRFPDVPLEEVVPAVRQGFSQAEVGGILGFNPVYRPSPESMPVNPALASRFQYVLSIRCQDQATGEYRFFNVVHQSDRNMNFRDLNRIAPLYIDALQGYVSNDPRYSTESLTDCNLFGITSVEYRGY